jgi:hypothetical protein
MDSVSFNPPSDRPNPPTLPPFDPPRPSIPARPPVVVPRPPVRVPGPIGAVSELFTTNQLAAYKAQYLAQHLTPEDLSFQYGNLVVTVEDIAYENSCLRLIIKAAWNGDTIPIDNPLYIYNPPVNVVTGYFWTLDETGPVLDKDVTENPVVALKMALVRICFSIAGIREE